MSEARHKWNEPPLGVYIHIPFCRTKCPYCDFLSTPIPGLVPNDFVDAVLREIAAFDGPHGAATIFFGGGTPSLLAPDSLERILRALHERFDFGDPAPETTIEANPDDVTPERARAWRAAGVNRLSIGVQSFDDRVLRYLGRRHDAAAARRACGIVADTFDNWGMDLIFAVPPAESWDATLDACLTFAPEHVSAYGLTYEPGTPFEHRAKDAASEDAWLRCFRETERRMAAYDHYEISNYALPEHRCQHNLIYWHNESYAGFGPGAYSFVNGVRARNEPDLAAYLARPGAKAESLTLEASEVRVETVIQHLRLRDGLPRGYYADRFGTPLENDFGRELAQLARAGLIEADDTHCRPTPRGYELNNEIGLGLL